MFCGSGLERVDEAERGGGECFWDEGGGGNWRRGGTEEREEGGAVTLITDQHVAVPRRQHHNTNVLESQSFLVQLWALTASIFWRWSRLKKKPKSGGSETISGQ